MPVSQELVDAFIRAACVPREDDGHPSHAAGTLEQAEALLAREPATARASIHAAAVLGDDVAIRRFLDDAPTLASATGGPHGWDPLTHLCFSRYLRLDRSRSDAFVRAATALLDAGADPNTGFFEQSHGPKPEWESAIYGAAGVAHHAPLTRLLLERGADPNDEETPYHAPEGWDNDALHALVESGKLNADSLHVMLLRKADWHDLEGIRWLLENGADPNAMGRYGKSALHNAILSDNSLAIVEAFLDHGGDPTLIATQSDRARGGSPPRSGVQVAARRGRGDLLELFERRGVPLPTDGLNALIAACARGDATAARAIAGRDPTLVDQLHGDGGELLAQFAGNGNTDGVALLLDLGVPVTALYGQGDGYFGIAPRSTALHVAAWRAWPSTVRLLIERGAPVNATDADGRTPLKLAVSACVDSYWAGRCTPECAEALLAAGASVSGVRYPSGRDDLDELLNRHGAG